MKLFRGKGSEQYAEDVKELMETLSNSSLTCKRIIRARQVMIDVGGREVRYWDATGRLYAEAKGGLVLPKAMKYWQWQRNFV